MSDFQDPVKLSGHAITAADADAWDAAASADEALRTVLPHVDPGDAAKTLEAVRGNPHLFSNKISVDVTPTSQHATGRCWLFAALNVARVAMMKRYGLPRDFELSPAYLFFHDKIERSNHFLHQVWANAEQGPGSRVIDFLTADPIGDGGQWDMVVALVEKHGVMPKECYPDMRNSKSSGFLNGVLKLKLREFAAKLVAAKAAGASDDEAFTLIRDTMMPTVHRIVSSCLSAPPKTISFEYSPKGEAGTMRGVSNVTPLEFYRTIVKPVFDYTQHVSLVHDPRPEHPVGSVMTVACLGNVVGSPHAVRYLNATDDTLKRLVIESIAADEPVWFGCDVGKSMDRARSLCSLGALDVGVFGGEPGMDKETRMRYSHSLMTHAMVFTGFHTSTTTKAMTDAPDPAAKKAAASDAADAPAASDATTSSSSSSSSAASSASPPAVADVSRFRVENSWGSKGDGKGFLSMTSDWFSLNVFQVVVPRSRLSAEDAAKFDEDPVVLPPWDPLGALAE